MTEPIDLPANKPSTPLREEIRARLEEAKARRLAARTTLSQKRIAHVLAKIHSADKPTHDKPDVATQIESNGTADDVGGIAMEGAIELQPGSEQPTGGAATNPIAAQREKALALIEPPKPGKT